MIDKEDWRKHKHLQWWRFNKYSIEKLGVEFVCRFGHKEIGSTNDGGKARKLCKDHATIKLGV